MSAIFVIVVKEAGACAACDHYKADEHDKLMDLLSHMRNVKVLLYTTNNKPGTRSLDKESHPELLKTYWKWWPNFMLFTEESWRKHDSDLKGFVMGADIMVDELGIRQMVESKTEHHDIRAESIKQWINNKLKDNMFNRVTEFSYNDHISSVRSSMSRRGSL